MSSVNFLGKKNSTPVLSTVLYVLGMAGVMLSAVYGYKCFDAMEHTTDASAYEAMHVVSLQIQVFSTALISSLLVLVIGGIVHLHSKLN